MKSCNCSKCVNFIEPDYKKAMMIRDESAFNTKSFENKRDKLLNEVSLLADK